MYIYLEPKSDQVTYFERNIPENQRRPSRFRADVFGQHRHTDAMALGHVLAKGLEGLVAIDSDLDV